MRTTDELVEARRAARRRSHLVSRRDTLEGRLVLTRREHAEAKARLQQVEKNLRAMRWPSPFLLTTLLSGRRTSLVAEWKEERDLLTWRLAGSAKTKAALEAEQQVAEAGLSETAGATARYRRLVLERSKQGSARGLEEAVEAFTESEATMREIREALVAARQTRSLARALRREFGHASSLGLVDILGGGLFISLWKHSQLSQARRLLPEVNASLALLAAELDDLEPGLQPAEAPGSAPFAFVVDVFIDFFVFDILIQRTIQDALQKATELHEGLGRLIDHLEARHAEAKAKAERLLFDLDAVLAV